jgi:hypothetical protein
MLRRLYLATLLTLQFALLVRVAPSLGSALRADAALGVLPDGWLTAVQFASAAGAVIGGALALTFPGLALLRHRQRGECRFRGMPRWAIGLALTGGSVFAAALLIGELLPLLARGTPMAVLLLARSAINAGLALMAAGVLCAELLRRSVGQPFAVPGIRRSLADLIEVKHPRDLATRAV